MAVVSDFPEIDGPVRVEVGFTGYGTAIKPDGFDGEIVLVAKDMETLKKAVDAFNLTYRIPGKEPLPAEFDAGKCREVLLAPMERTSLLPKEGW